MSDPRRCVGCGGPLTYAQWGDRHDLNAEAAAAVGVDPGYYHEGCCPKCAEEGSHDE